MKLTCLYNEKTSVYPVNADFSSTSMSFNFVSATRKCMAVPLVNDAVTENNEEFLVILEAMTPEINLGISNTTVIIIDDDGKQTI